MNVELRTLKSKYSITQGWHDLGLPGKPGKCVPSPFRRDQHASFSVFRVGDEEHFKDHATGEHGDVFDFVVLALGTMAAAIEFILARVGQTPIPPRQQPVRSQGKLPILRAGTEAEIRQLAELRGFHPEALMIAQEREFLWFSKLWGHSAWCLTDQRRQLHEFRRLDGQPWPAFGSLRARKAHSLGTGKNWPIGTLESVPFGTVAWAEGGPDLLAAIHFLRLENKLQRVAPVAVLGAANHRLAPEALAHFARKTVWLFPHVDDAGRNAMRSWARQLRDTGAARVTAFDLSGLVLADGSPGKDLADVARISADCFERETKFKEVMP